MSSEETFIDDIEKDDDIRTFIGNVLENFDKEIDKIWLESLEVPLTVEAAIGKIEKMVAWATCAYDGKMSNDALEVHVPDEEPVPALVDTWARGIGMLF